MFRATMCPSSGADDCVMFSPRVGIVPWLQEGCRDWLVGSASIDEFVAQLVGFHIHTELRCTVNHTSDMYSSSAKGMSHIET